MLGVPECCANHTLYLLSADPLQTQAQLVPLDKVRLCPVNKPVSQRVS